MEFGRVPEKELDKVNFALPKDPSFNKEFLKGKRLKNPAVYVGCAKWGRKEWVGKIYPLKTKEKDFLKHYLGHYNSIELNATHHKLYGAKGIANWESFATGKDFLFCPKMYKGITHSGKLKHGSFLFNEYFRGIRAFGENLGPVFIQVNETFSPKRKDELIEFLKGLPNDLQFFLELRHPGWFVKKEFMVDFFSILANLKIGMVITDTAGRRDCAHMYLTISKVFIRFTGNSLHPTDYSRIDEWVRRIKSWLTRGLKEVYFFMHMHEEATSPELSLYLVEQLNKQCGLKLIPPKFV